jgi:hypothetical protein
MQLWLLLVLLQDVNDEQRAAWRKLGLQLLSQVLLQLNLNPPPCDSFLRLLLPLTNTCLCRWL